MDGEGASIGKQIQNPFTLKVSDVNKAIRKVCDDMVPSESEEQDKIKREKIGLKRRAECLERFLKGSVDSFKRSPAQRVKDMGTVMHLILREEIARLKAQSVGV